MASSSTVRIFGMALLVALVIFLAVIFLGTQIGPCACPVPASTA